MNLRRRITITRISLWYIRVRSAGLVLAAQLLLVFARVHIALAGKIRGINILD